ncbi:MAG: aminotransferase class I/II-fold pyridoxal phosphate-dependent enzyme, partial [Planctomycetaceae bacterium]
SFVDTGQFLAVQAAARAALESYDEWVPSNVSAFQERRDALVAALNQNGFNATSPRATMYLWFPAPGGDSHAFARRALLDEGVVVMPGAALGAGGEGWLRAALTQAPDRLRDAAVRLGRVLANGTRPHASVRTD